MSGKKAGRFEIEVWDGGSPVWSILKDASNGADLATCLTIEDLHDLKYLAERTIAHLDRLPQ